MGQVRVQHRRWCITPWPWRHETHCSSGGKTITTSFLEDPGACGHWCAICPSRLTRWPLADSSGRTARLWRVASAEEGSTLAGRPKRHAPTSKKVLWVLCKMPAHVVTCLVALAVRRDMLMKGDGSWWLKVVNLWSPPHHPLYRFRHMWLRKGTLASGGRVHSAGRPKRHAPTRQKGAMSPLQDASTCSEMSFAYSFFLECSEISTRWREEMQGI